MKKPWDLLTKGKKVNIKTHTADIEGGSDGVYDSTTQFESDIFTSKSITGTWGSGSFVPLNDSGDVQTSDLVYKVKVSDSGSEDEILLRLK